MVDPRMGRIEALFHSARVMAPPRRDVWLTEQCGDDFALRAEVIALLQSDAAGEGIVTDALATAGRDALGAVALSAALGRVVGAWRLLAPLGSGGMGSVFRAERCDGAYRQEAALKMLNPWLLGSRFERRFAQERQMLSELRHPGIAALLDGGVGPEGVPYLVMELVEGESIVTHADRHRLDVAACLRLLMQACMAVQHAHQHLVIHRDIKPANMLVDAQGKVKLLDFGIATLLRHPSESGAWTATATHLLTPEYASPEQREQRPIGTSSDVYSLGLVLYELLAGARAPRGRADSNVTLRPSELCLRRAQDASPAEAWALQRRASLLRGDLDTVVMKSLAPSPERRYATARELHDDLERFLSHQPLQARPDSLAYRIRMFVRRHRVGVVLSASAVLLLTSAGIGLALLSLRLAAERDVSAEARSRAEREARAAEQVAGFLGRLFEATDPILARGAPPTLRDVLERGAIQIEDELSDEPAVQARLLVLMANAFRQHGAEDRGIELARRAVALRRAQQPFDPSALADALESLGELLRTAGDFAQAEALHRETLALRRAQSPADPIGVGRALNNLGLTAFEDARDAEALALFTESLEVRRGHLDPSAPPLLATQVNLGLVQRVTGDRSAAEATLREVYEQRLRSLGEVHPATANVMTLLARSVRERGGLDEAEDLLRRSLAARRALHGEVNGEVAGNVSELGIVQQQGGRLTEAEASFRTAIDLLRRERGTEHPEPAMDLGRLAQNLLRQGRAAEAEAPAREAFDLVQRHLHATHPRRATLGAVLGAVLLALDREAESRTLFESAHRLQQDNPRVLPLETVPVLLGLAEHALRRGETGASVALLDEIDERLRDAPRSMDVLREHSRRLRLRSSLGL